MQGTREIPKTAATFFYDILAPTVKKYFPKSTDNFFSSFKAAFTNKRTDYKRVSRIHLQLTDLLSFIV